MSTRLFAILVSSILAIAAVAQEPAKKHPIDVRIEKAQDEALSTADQREVQELALKLWDAEMNRVYAKLRKALKPEAAAALQAAQREWLKYRDSQVKFLDEMYAAFEGTMFIPMHAASVAAVTRDRSLALTHLLGAQEEFGE
jgi:uncharacterized protein YecT (DUF1311 family)